jgi:hypothetical protein
VLAALDLSLMAGLIMGASVFLFGLLAGRTLLMLAGTRLMRALLGSLMGMLAALYLRFMARLVVGTFVVLSCHRNPPVRTSDFPGKPGCVLVDRSLTLLSPLN